MYGLQHLVSIGFPEYDFEVNPEYPVLTLLRNICQAQRTFAHDYLVFGKMLRPTDLEVAKTKVDIFQGIRCQRGEEVVDLPGIDVPRVLHGVWSLPHGKTGYILVNWTGKPEKVVLALVKSEGVVSIITHEGEKTVSQEEIKKGNLTATIPPRGIVVVEQQ